MKSIRILIIFAILTLISLKRTEREKKGLNSSMKKGKGKFRSKAQRNKLVVAWGEAINCANLVACQQAFQNQCMNAGVNMVQQDINNDPNFAVGGRAMPGAMLVVPAGHIGGVNLQIQKAAIRNAETTAAAHQTDAHTERQLINGLGAVNAGDTILLFSSKNSCATVVGGVNIGCSNFLINWANNNPAVDVIVYYHDIYRFDWDFFAIAGEADRAITMFLNDAPGYQGQNARKLVRCFMEYAADAVVPAVDRQAISAWLDNNNNPVADVNAEGLAGNQAIIVGQTLNKFFTNSDGGRFEVANYPPGLWTAMVNDANNVSANYGGLVQIADLTAVRDRFEAYYTNAFSRPNLTFIRI